MSAGPSTDARSSECDGHVDLSAEVLALARAALDRLDPVLDRLRAAPPEATRNPDAPPRDSATPPRDSATPPRDSATPPRDTGAGPGPSGPADRPCAVCPVCAVIAVLRGDRPELAQRLAEQVSGLVALARDALAEPGPSTGAPSESRSDERTASGSPKRVQRIPVERVGAAG